MNRLSQFIALCTLLACSADAVYAQRTLTLDECLAIAKQQSPSLVQAKQSYQIASANAEASDRSLRSTVDLTLNAPLYTDVTEPVFNTSTGTSDLYTQRESRFGAGLTVKQPIFWTGGSVSVTGNAFRRHQQNLQGLGKDDFLGAATIQLDQPIFRANEWRIRAREAEMGLELAKAQYLTQTASLNYRVKSLFFNLYQAEQELSIKRIEVETSDSAYQQASRKLKAGLIAEVDALQLEADLAAAQTDLFDRERRYDAAQRELLLALGLPLSEKVTAKLDTLAGSGVTVDADRAIRTALISRTDMLNAKFDVERREFAVDRLASQRQISASLRGSFGASQNADVFSQLTQNPFVNRGIDLSINVPIFDWGAHSLQMDAAYTETEMTKISLYQREREVEQEVRSVLEQLVAARRQIEAAKKALTVAERAYEVSSERFAIGKITSQDLSLAQQRLTRARLSALGAQVAERLALADLVQKTLYDFERNRPVEEPE